MIVAEVDTFEVIGTSPVAELSEWTVIDYYPSSDEDTKDDLTVVVNGFHVLDTQVIYKAWQWFNSCFNIWDKPIRPFFVVIYTIFTG